MGGKMENDKMRMNHIADMKQIEKEISFTKSEYRKRDLRKRLFQMQKELREYDSYRRY